MFIFFQTPDLHSWSSYSVYSVFIHDDVEEKYEITKILLFSCKKIQLLLAAHVQNWTKHRLKRVKTYINVCFEPKSALAPHQNGLKNHQRHKIFGFSDFSSTSSCINMVWMQYEDGYWGIKTRGGNLLYRAQNLQDWSDYAKNRAPDRSRLCNWC